MHRGRIQVQGNDLARELVWAWAEATPPTAAAAIDALNDLKAQLTDAELALRREAFERAARFIRNAAASGGVSAQVSRTFRNRRLASSQRTARVDIEVHTGRAFIP
jgi:hypothetical protein